MEGGEGGGGGRGKRRGKEAARVRGKGAVGCWIYRREAREQVAWRWATARSRVLRVLRTKKTTRKRWALGELG